MPFCLLYHMRATLRLIRLIKSSIRLTTNGLTFSPKTKDFDYILRVTRFEKTRYAHYLLLGRGLGKPILGAQNGFPQNYLSIPTLLRFWRREDEPLMMAWKYWRF